MNKENQQITEASYFAERYSEACDKLIEKTLSEFDYKSLAKYFNAKELSRYDEERFKSFCKQIKEYFKNGLRVKTSFLFIKGVF